jgi:hypothetical protein
VVRQLRASERGTFTAMNALGLGVDAPGIRVAIMPGLCGSCAIMRRRAARGTGRHTQRGHHRADGAARPPRPDGGQDGGAGGRTGVEAGMWTFTETTGSSGS